METNSFLSPNGQNPYVAKGLDNQEIEKYLLLGQLVSGITHELNTPIGSATAAASNLEDLLASIQKKEAILLKKIDSATYSSISQLIDVLHKDLSLPPLNTRQERALKKNYIQKLEEKFGEKAEEIATFLIESGFRSEIDKIETILQHSLAQDILEYISLKGQVQKNLIHLKTAAQKAMHLMRMVKLYLQMSSEATEPTYIDLKTIFEILLTLFHNRIKHGIQLETYIDNIAEIQTLPAILIQILATFLEHSIEAMRRNGKLKIETHQYLNVVEITFEDSRPPIEEHLYAHFLEPNIIETLYGRQQAEKISKALQVLPAIEGNLSYEQKQNTFCLSLTLPLQLSN
ncbi:MAG: hypothetical protein RML72_04150 [Bacteroidia bacterium]|nr:hypothetical protein [Bacteroidia bacterium]MDW8158055.1 hypothetical protein [Bacteroidia bacterium]